MKQIRTSIFETNSSSSHVFCVDKKYKLEELKNKYSEKLANEVIDKDGNIHIEFKDHYIRGYKSVISDYKGKFSYIFQLIYDNLGKTTSSFVQEVLENTSVKKKKSLNFLFYNNYEAMLLIGKLLQHLGLLKRLNKSILENEHVGETIDNFYYLLLPSNKKHVKILIDNKPSKYDSWGIPDELFPKSKEEKLADSSNYNLNDEIEDFIIKASEMILNPECVIVQAGDEYINENKLIYKDIFLNKSFELIGSYDEWNKKISPKKEIEAYLSICNDSLNNYDVTYVDFTVRKVKCTENKYNIFIEIESYNNNKSMDYYKKLKEMLNLNKCNVEEINFEQPGVNDDELERLKVHITISWNGLTCW